MTRLVPWRDACEKALRVFSDADAIRLWGIGHEVNGTYRPIFNYRFEHTTAAVLLARWLAPATGADLEVVECAAWLHDVAKRLRDPGSKDTHAQDASAQVEEILADTDFPKAKVPAVRVAIERHVGLRLAKRLEPLEAACLWDCDKLSKIGAASLIHFGCISGAFQPITTAEILHRGEAWIPLARGIVASLNTGPAQEEGRRRLTFLEAHYAQLRREWSDPAEVTPPMSGFLELAQSLAMAIKSLQMYTAAHPRTQQAVAASHGQLERVLAEQERMQFVTSGGKAFVDGQVVEARSPQLTSLIRQVSERGLNGFHFERGVTVVEYLAFLEILILKPQRIEEQGGFEALLAAQGVRHIKVSQTRYEEVREGDGGEADREGRPPAFDAAPTPAAPSPSPDSLVKVIREALLAALSGAGMRPDGSADTAGTVGVQGFLPADLSGLGPLGVQLGLGEGLPTPAQLGTLRQVLMSLSPEMQYSLLAGLATLPAHPQGLGLGVRALAGEMLAVATSSMLDKGVTWNQLRGPLQEILRPLPDREALVRALAVHLRSMGMDGGQAEVVLRRLDWENLSLEARLLKVLEEGHLFELSHEQRLAFLRELLDLRRFDEFLRIQEILLEVLRSDLAELRLKAVQTLAGIARWAEDPGLPFEIEGPLAEALRAHFAWEADPPIHRWNAEALESLLSGLVRRGDLVNAMADLSELQGLCEFQEEQLDWRNEALARLKASLVRPALLESATAQIFGQDKDQLATAVYPYFEFLGGPMAEHLIARLGDEQDRTKRGRLVEAIRSLGPAALPPLMEALASPTWYLVRNALSLLGDLGDAGCTSAIVPLLRHPEPRVRRTAVRALWKLGGPAAEPHLVARLRDTDVETLQEILFVLGQMRSESALPPISELAQDKRAPERLRLQALDALAHIASPQSLPVLSELLQRKGFFASTEPLPIRLGAAKALAALGSPASQALLQKVLGSEPKGEDREALRRVVAP